MNKVSFVFITTFFALIFVASPAYANMYGCNTTYGHPCPTSETIVINKEVQNPSDNNFVDNLGMNDAKFSPSQNVNFRVTITNTSNRQLSDVTITDTLPSYVTFVSGAGNYDAGSKKLTFHVQDLKAGESRTFTIVAKTVAASDLPAGQGITCVTNSVTAWTNTMSTSDNAGFCIQTQVTTKGGLTVFPAPKVTTTPGTGAESLALFGLIPSMFAGFAIRKKASK